LALPPDREAVSARSGLVGGEMSKSIPPCPCIGVRCELRRPRGPFPSRGAPCWWRNQDAPLLLAGSAGLGSSSKHTPVKRVTQVSNLGYARSLLRCALPVSLLLAVGQSATAESFQVLKPAAFTHHIEHFNRMEDENYTNCVSDAASWDWLQANIPLFECPDREVEEIYYFRWWSFRKHIAQTTNGFVLTEFLTPVGHSGPFNTISCAAGHHLAEGRWLRDPRYLDDYTRFWLRGVGGKPEPHFHKYSSWFASAVYDRYLVNHDRTFVVKLLDDLVNDYRAWEREHRLTNGLFWQFDVRDGMEESISGSRTEKNIRPTINSYMFANARAIASIARLARRPEVARTFDQTAAELKRLIETNLWSPEAQFFEVRRPDSQPLTAAAPRVSPAGFGVRQSSGALSSEPTAEDESARGLAQSKMLARNHGFSGVREELGFIPWCFDLPDPGYEAAWKQLMDRDGFWAPCGITTAERRHPLFRSHGCCRCEWDGAVWPFATSQTLTALANLLRDYSQSIVSTRDYFETFLTYTSSQYSNGKPYIGEYVDETTGQWLSSKPERSRYYNHSTFADPLITGLVGLRTRDDDTIEISPLLPSGAWPWFCLDGVKYHGRLLTIFWDADGSRYGRGAGLYVLAAGHEIAHMDKLGRITGKLP
jgi:hypothetical protein